MENVDEIDGGEMKIMEDEFEGVFGEEEVEMREFVELREYMDEVDFESEEEEVEGVNLLRMMTGERRRSYETKGLIDILKTPADMGMVVMPWLGSAEPCLEEWRTKFDEELDEKFKIAVKERGAEVVYRVGDKEAQRLLEKFGVEVGDLDVEVGEFCEVGEANVKRKERLEVKSREVERRLKEEKVKFRVMCDEMEREIERKGKERVGELEKTYKEVVVESNVARMVRYLEGLCEKVEGKNKSVEVLKGYVGDKNIVEVVERMNGEVKEMCEEIEAFLYLNLREGVSKRFEYLDRFVVRLGEVVKGGGGVSGVKYDAGNDYVEKREREVFLEEFVEGGKHMVSGRFREEGYAEWVPTEFDCRMNNIFQAAGGYRV